MPQSGRVTRFAMAAGPISSKSHSAKCFTSGSAGSDGRPSSFSSDVTFSARRQSPRNDADTERSVE